MSDAKDLRAQGYRRTSNRHHLVSRIDRPDWAEALAEYMHQGRDKADEYRTANWADFYRRVLSNDTLTVSAYTAKAVGASGNDPVGFVPRATPKESPEP